MNTDTWPPELVLGQPAIDAAHRALAERVAGLLAGNDSGLEAGVPALIDDIEADFRAEEELMEQIGFPGMQPHLEQHARVLAALHHIDPLNYAAARSALQLLMEWFQVHVATMDNVLAIALQLAGGAGQAGVGTAHGTADGKAHTG